MLILVKAIRYVTHEDGTLVRPRNYSEHIVSFLKFEPRILSNNGLSDDWSWVGDQHIKRWSKKPIDIIKEDSKYTYFIVSPERFSVEKSPSEDYNTIARMAICAYRENLLNELGI